jgi:hypothetical protein
VEGPIVQQERRRTSASETRRFFSSRDQPKIEQECTGWQGEWLEPVALCGVLGSFASITRKLHDSFPDRGKKSGCRRSIDERFELIQLGFYCLLLLLILGISEGSAGEIVRMVLCAFGDGTLTGEVYSHGK